jgi:hypothetical protein
MKILKTILNNSRQALLISLAAIPLAACAEMTTKPDDGTPIVPGNKISDFNYAISTDKSGHMRPVVMRKDGTKIPGEHIPRNNPVKATSIEEIETFTIVRAKGSHYFVVMIAGKSYKFDIQH